MLKRILDFLDEHASAWERAKLQPVDWVPIVERIRDHIGEGTIFLLTRQGGFVRLETARESDLKEDVVGVAVTYQAAGCEAWDTQAPVRQIARDLPVLLSRDHRSFVGYYVLLEA